VMLCIDYRVTLRWLLPLLVAMQLLVPWLGAISTGLAIGATLCLAIRIKSTS
jgi:hypothetical protein